ncbi:MAG TPA: DinB family protein [Candidatus Limnocylindrales bacterium]|nr:DinB family protein [Candidatus Limnocylindrales bacterium]
MEQLTYDDEAAFTLADDAATVSAIVRRTPVDRLRGTRFGEWTAVEAIGHLAATAEVFAERVRRCLEEDRPSLPAMPEGAGADADADPLELSRRLLRAHQIICRLLQDEAARDRTGIHGEWGEVSAGHLAAYQAGHSHEHALELAKAFPPG